MHGFCTITDLLRMFSLTVLLIRSLKEEVPILVLTQALDSDDESVSSSPPPAIVFSPVWLLTLCFYLFYLRHEFFSSLPLFTRLSAAKVPFIQSSVP